MLCQNCGKNEATTHLKRIIGGEKTEMHLCSQCAKALGYGSMFNGFWLDPGDLFGGLFGEIPLNKTRGRTVRCEKCGCSFDDIVKSGMVGCADCYKTFYDKLLPSLQRIHGKTEHQGKFPRGANEETKRIHMITELKSELSKAVDEQDFERAAKLRDEIKDLESQSGSV